MKGILNLLISLKKAKWKCPQLRKKREKQENQYFNRKKLKLDFRDKFRKIGIQNETKLMKKEKKKMVQIDRSKRDVIRR